MNTICKVLLAFGLVALVDATLLRPQHTPLRRRSAKQVNSKATAVLDNDEENLAQGTQDAAQQDGVTGKYFMDTIMIETGPKQVEFGHVCEDPDEWEQRYERRDEEAKRYQGKVGLTAYQQVPHHDLYEFGYHRGNDHHFTERYEKAHPHHGHFQTKARWGDKHGGYGEHYWDYNHGDHHGEDDEGSSEDTEGDGSSPKSSKHQPRKIEDGSEKRVEERRKQKDAEAAGTSVHDLSLTYDVATGLVINKATGRRYKLTPIS